MKWEARENRLVDQLEAVKRDHSSFDGSQLERSKELQLAAEKQLAVAQQRVTVLEQLGKDQKQRIDELTTELVLAQTKLRGLESAGRVGGAKVSTPPLPTSSVTGSLVGTTTDSAIGSALTPAFVPSVALALPLSSTTPLSAPSAGTSSVTVVAGLMSTTVCTTAVAPATSSVMGTAGSAPRLCTSVSGITLPRCSGITEITHTSPTTVMVAPASLMTQLPPNQRFGGEDIEEGETFQDWKEQFEAIAMMAGWNDHSKLVNLTTRLRGAAYSFYRSCTPEQRSSYTLLVAELQKRFTPVQLTAIQPQLFHDRQQGAKESVDDYAQALRKLFKKAYSTVLRGEPEADSMG